ncbi:ankyrin repeat-containing protein BDA1-like [Chenopodium quinoa]|uniref:ankyrin repeat-containing protein BDA1-like n=1 Tax=Chenopodium quinoa TaxID=63459 RepID=UPI000B79990E|nr:ankyrin repeat-containing protein BDA1-like [Chenopodium quinoa]
MARLYDAALKGDVHSLNNLLQEDALILERCIIERGRYTQSPLHVAAKMGHLDFVKTVLEANSTMRFAHDEDGMTPVHVAAIHGKIDVLETFHSEEPQAIRELTKSGETVLHLCVKHNQMEALLLLLNHKDEIDLELLINSEDSDGNTILHLAVIDKQVEIDMIDLANEICNKILK